MHACLYMCIYIYVFSHAASIKICSIKPEDSNTHTKTYMCVYIHVYGYTDSYAATQQHDQQHHTRRQQHTHTQIPVCIYMYTCVLTHILPNSNMISSIIPGDSNTQTLAYVSVYVHIHVSADTNTATQQQDQQHHTREQPRRFCKVASAETDRPQRQRN